MTVKHTKLKDIAKAAGVDTSTVSLCLNDSPKVADKTKKKIKELAASMDYHPNITAKALRMGKSKTVGIGLAQLGHPFFDVMLRTMEDYFYQNQYSSLVSVLRYEDYKRLFNDMFHRNVDGLCLSNPAFVDGAEDLYKKFVNAGKPLSMFIEKEGLERMDGVVANFAVCDLPKGTEGLLNHLYELNHRRISMIGLVPYRYHSYCSFLEQKGIELDETIVINSADRIRILEESILSMLKLRNPPTAIFANSDKIAVKIMRILLDNGIRIPEDISLVSINDTPMMDMLKVPLTTLRIPVAEIGESVAEMVLDQIKDPNIGPRKKFFDTELIIRDSTTSI